jgi:hypothetical protein
MTVKIALLDVFGLLVRKKIGFLELDAVISETINLNNTVTSAPIETGENVTDHVYNEPLELSMECIVSDSDIVRSISLQANPVARIQAYESLVDLWKAKTPVDVVAGYEVYPNMLITSISIPRANDDGDSIRFNVSFLQANILDSLFLSDKSGRVNVGRKQGVIASNSISAIAQRTIERLRA